MAYCRNSENEPLWAYGFETVAKPGDKAQPQNPPNRNLRPNQDPEEQTRLRQIKGSKAAYSLVDVRDGQNVIDWFPEDHPTMPDVIVHGPAALGAKKRGCGSCHLPTGKDRPENAAPAGLPYPYILRQLQDFRSGRRYTSDPRKPNTPTMIGKTTPCITCHGEDLMGVADIPQIAGRSPSYMVRQMWDIKRTNEQAQLMKLVLANLTPDDMLAIAAHVASRPPHYPSKTETVSVTTQNIH